MEVYLNKDRKCECWRCERNYQNNHDVEHHCPYYEKYQAPPKDISRNGLGLCPKLKENGWDPETENDA